MKNAHCRQLLFFLAIFFVSTGYETTPLTAAAARASVDQTCCICHKAGNVRSTVGCRHFVHTECVERTKVRSCPACEWENFRTSQEVDLETTLETLKFTDKVEEPGEDRPFVFCQRRREFVQGVFCNKCKKYYCSDTFEKYHTEDDDSTPCRSSTKDCLSGASRKTSRPARASGCSVDDAASCASRVSSYSHASGCTDHTASCDSLSSHSSSRDTLYCKCLKREVPKAFCRTCQIFYCSHCCESCHKAK